MSPLANPAPKRALIVIDVQNDYFNGSLNIAYPNVAVSLPNIGAAMDAAHAAGIPVVVVQHIAPAGAPIFARGSAGADLHPAIAGRACDLLVEKTRTSALDGTPLADWLRERGIDTLTLAGYMTHNCDLATTLHAVREGWKVELLGDASGSLAYANAAGTASAEEIHRVVTVVMHTGFAAVAGTADWIEAIRAGRPLPVDGIHRSYRRALGEAD